jgi:putative ATPase
MKELGYGREYRYAHDAPDGFVADPNLPEPIARARFYEPKEIGAEAPVAARLAAWRRRRADERED